MMMKRVANKQIFVNIASLNKIRTFILVKNNNSHSLLSRLHYPLIMLMAIFISCTGGGERILDETPTRGDIKISVDESFKSILETEIFTFTHLYTNAKIKAEYKPEYDVISDFMNDSVKVIVTSKKLTDHQIQTLRDTLVVARTTTYAYDALALITNKQNQDTLLNYNTIQDIFLGKVKKWKDIDPLSKLGDIRVIFDNNKSGNIRYFKEQFDITESLPENFFAVNNNPEVIDFVSRNPDALGIISVNWISDEDDSTSMSYKNKINIVAVSQKYFNDGTYYRPAQGSIYDRSYPFVREVYLISRETFRGLGSGFINWACAEQGQRIVLKSGLVPATMPIRLVQMK